MLNRTGAERAVASPKRAGLVSSVLAALALIVTIGAAEAIACTCAPIRTETSCRDIATAGRVLEAFVGTVGTEVRVSTSPDSASCGYRFDEGSRYIVYAFARPDGQLTTSRCSRTKHLANIGGELRFLRAPATRQTTPVTGRVRLREENYGTGSLSSRPVAGARFVLSGDRQYEAVSDRDGAFAIDVPTGKYAVQLLVADDLYVGALPRLPRQLDLSDTRACPNVEAVVHSDGHVSGRLVMSDGQPAAGLAVEIVGVNNRRRAAFSASADARGAFDIGQVAPGRYSVRLASDPGLLLPTRASPGDPTEFILQSGQRRALGDLVLPAGVRIVQLAGRVVDANNRPIAGAEVVVRSASDQSYGRFEPIRTDADGSFSAAVVASGAPYRVTVGLEDPHGWGARSPHSITDVPASEMSTPLLLRPTPRR